MTTTALTDLHGFVRADCAACNNPDVWLTCNSCKKSDRFLLEGAGVTCACGTRYDHAVCTCQKTVPGDRLRWVPFEKGPAALAEWEIDKRRLAGIALLVVSLVGLGAWWMFG